MSRTPVGHYTLWDELMADAVKPLPLAHRLYTIGGMQQALDSIKRDPQPSVLDWRVLSDMVNLMNTLVDMGELLDARDLLDDAHRAMSIAAAHHKAGRALRFDGPGVQAMDALFADYTTVVNELPARVLIRCHRATEKRMRAIHKGHVRSTDQIVEL